MEVIEIIDGVVELKNVSTVRRVKLNDFKESLILAAGVRTPILPSNTIFYGSKNGTRVYLIERKPALVTILYKKDGKSLPKEFRIPFPYHYFLIEFEGFAFESCHFFLRNKRLTKLDDALYFPPLPNLNNHDCSVCLGDFKYRVTADVLENIESLEKYFFDSAFNTDLSQLFHGKIPRQIASLKRGGRAYF